jgi:enoyl-CoA hydratase/carnithine racemase
MAEQQFQVEEVSNTYWRIRFANGPVNLIDPDTVEELAELIMRLENAPDLTVALFYSDNPDFFMAHWDIRSDRARVAAMQAGPTGLHPYLDNFVRLSGVPLLTISAIRGRARAAGSEFVLATDVRFAGDKAILGQFEVGIGAVPGGGAMARLARLVGRGRALEILLGGDDFPAELAAQYGYVNRVFPDAELDDAADRFARRVAQFDKTAVQEIKHLVDVSAMPAQEEFAPGLDAFFRTSGRPQQLPRVKALFEQGLQQADGAELDLGARLENLPPADQVAS